jgi:6,7-dimethyl-8-ribityllumazine synthase
MTMGRELEGQLVARDVRFAVVVSRFNELVTRQLLEGARNGLRRHGVAPEGIDVAWVPGSFEIPLVAQRMAASGRYAAVLCLGAVIRGETSHFEHVVAGVTTGVARIALDTGIPVIFGILTTDSLEQALDRAGMKAGNKGYEAAISAIEMANLMSQLDG